MPKRISLIKTNIPERIDAIRKVVRAQYTEEIRAARGSALSEDVIHVFVENALNVSRQSNHFFYDIVSEGKLIGFSWVSDEQDRLKTMFLHFLYIDPGSRGLGYGKDAVKELCWEGKSRGLISLSLHVFSQNLAAISFYNSVGFTATGIQMFKPI